MGLNSIFLLSIILLVLICAFYILSHIFKSKKNKEIEELFNDAAKSLGLANFNIMLYADNVVIVKSRKAFDNYGYIKFLKEDNSRIQEMSDVLRKKARYTLLLNNFLVKNDYKQHRYYNILKDKIDELLTMTYNYRICVRYYSSKTNAILDERIIGVNQKMLNNILDNPELIMSKSEYNKMIKAQEREENARIKELEKEAKQQQKENLKAEKERNKELEKSNLENKRREYYDKVNSIINAASNSKASIIVKKDLIMLDNLIGNLFDRTVNSIQKIKTYDSQEWEMIDNLIINLVREMNEIIQANKKILAYYSSSDFIKIKETCESLMSTQREFNEYIDEKAQSISQLFGTRITRNETVVEDEYEYIRPYKKTITPFTAEVSAQVFASAENNPLEYVVKYFYPNKDLYPEQIQKLKTLIEELETLKDAKGIIENYKLEYKDYIQSVPDYILENDESGFYARLGFANIDESTLTVEYKFSYTSDGGMAQRSFTVPMTENTIIELINILQNKMTTKSFTYEQRRLMTTKLRKYIKERDNFTCCQCGNSTYIEPNLLLEVDHIIPVAKGGLTEENNLQTLCWKCNRAKSDKIQ